VVPQVQGAGDEKAVQRAAALVLADGVVVRTHDGATGGGQGEQD